MFLCSLRVLPRGASVYWRSAASASDLGLGAWQHCLLKASQLTLPMKYSNPHFHRRWREWVSRGWSDSLKITREELESTLGLHHCRAQALSNTYSGGHCVQTWPGHLPWGPHPLVFYCRDPNPAFSAYWPCDFRQITSLCLSSLITKTGIMHEPIESCENGVHTVRP